MKTMLSLLFACVAILALPANVQAQHDHSHVAVVPQEKQEKPKVFLDRSPRAVAYQLKRLNNQRLLMVDRKPDDKKYAPVYTAILTRAGMSPQFREEAVEALVAINQSSNASVLLDVLAAAKTESREEKATAKQLSRMLLKQPIEKLKEQGDALTEATASENEFFSSVGFAGLIVSGQADAAWKVAESGLEKSWLASIALVPDVETRNRLQPHVVKLLQKPDDIKIAAIKSLRHIKSKPDETFALMAAVSSDEKYLPAAVKTMLGVPAKFRNAEVSQNMVDFLITRAEKTKPAERTSNQFIDTMQLVDQCMASVPAEKAKAYRARLNKVSVRVVRILTVKEEMRYDVPFFAVQAGTDVQVVMDNVDLMPHNLVITQPGQLKLVAELGLAAGPKNGLDGKPYVPKSEHVIEATGMVAASSTERLTFTAPKNPGAYPYVCTYPQHWSRMYGVMVMVEDLDAWLKNPVKPEDPIGSDRSFVNDWSVDKLAPELEAGIRGRTMKIGNRIFEEATCVQWHKLGGEGGAVGPELDEVFAKWKGDQKTILREILTPSHFVDEKYKMEMILTIDGLTISGIVQNEDDEKVQLLDNPEAKELTTVLQDDIEERQKTTMSIMPKALMNNFTKDEIFELFAYMKNSQKK